MSAYGVIGLENLRDDSEASICGSELGCQPGSQKLKEGAPIFGGWPRFTKPRRTSGDPVMPQMFMIYSIIIVAKFSAAARADQIVNGWARQFTVTAH